MGRDLKGKVTTVMGSWWPGGELVVEELDEKVNTYQTGSFKPSGRGRGVREGDRGPGGGWVET